jgi:hypothetical protein
MCSSDLEGHFSFGNMKEWFGVNSVKCSVGKKADMDEIPLVSLKILSLSTKEILQLKNITTEYATESSITRSSLNLGLIFFQLQFQHRMCAQIIRKSIIWYKTFNYNVNKQNKNNFCNVFSCSTGYSYSCVNSSASVTTQTDPPDGLSQSWRGFLQF